MTFAEHLRRRSSWHYDVVVVGTGVAGLSAALTRTESRRAHCRADCPSEDPARAGHFVLRPGQAPVLEEWA